MLFHLGSVFQPDSASDWWNFAATAMAAIATSAAVVVALWVARSDRKRAALNEKRAQAERITVWLDTRDTSTAGTFMVSNASTSAIFEAVLGYGAAYGGGLRFVPSSDEGNSNLTFVITIPPGRWRVQHAYFEGGAMHMVPQAAICFRDAAGRSWMRDASGKLGELQQSPIKQAGAIEPVSSWSIAAQAD